MPRKSGPESDRVIKFLAAQTNGVLGAASVPVLI